jgi:hypothetical protein
MVKTKTKPIKAKTGWTRMTPIELLARGTAVHTGISGDPTDYPAPTVAMPAFKEHLDLYVSKITAALDGGKQAIADRDREGEVVIKMMRQLAHYVEASCKERNDDLLEERVRDHVHCEAYRPAVVPVHPPDQAGQQQRPTAGDDRSRTRRVQL